MGEVNYDRVDAGYSTARLSAAQQDRLAREQREAAARRWLLARDLADVAEVLGLIPPTDGRPRRRRKDN